MSLSCLTNRNSLNRWLWRDRGVVLCRLGLVVMVSLLGMSFPGGWVPQATASCGDWLAHPVTAVGDVAKPSANSVSDKLLGTGLQLGLLGKIEQHERWIVHPLPKDPCEGGRCQRAPLPPLPPLPVRIGGTDQQWAETTFLNDAQRRSSHFLYGARDEGRALRGFPFRIKRPPRV